MSRASDEDDDVPKPLDTALDAFLSDVHLHVIASDRSTTQGTFLWLTLWQIGRLSCGRYPP
eukprot:m.128791 g.128791  ORF g.128791 m.128791 type:complete len:61 (+) comp15680_c0_seq1:164-346(+)